MEKGCIFDSAKTQKRKTMLKQTTTGLEATPSAEEVYSFFGYQNTEEPYYYETRNIVILHRTGRHTDLTEIMPGGFHDNVIRRRVNARVFVIMYNV